MVMTVSAGPLLPVAVSPGSGVTVLLMMIPALGGSVTAGSTATVTVIGVVKPGAISVMVQCRM